MFAAEARGDVPKGTARRWAHETKSIKSLPEKKMKKEGMFFGDREQVADGNFMKLSQLKMPKDVRPKPTLKPPPAKTQEVKPGEQVPKTPGLVPPKPKPAMGTGCKVAHKIAQAMPFGTGVGIGGSPQFGGSGTAQTQMAATQSGAGGMPAMGTGKKPKKMAKKAAKDESLGEVAGRLPGAFQRSGEAVAKGTGKAALQAAQAIEKAPPWAHAAMLGIPAYMLYRKGKGAVKALAGAGKAAPAAGGVATALRKLLTRGK
jgi:hypothetical protein